MLRWLVTKFKSLFHIRQAMDDPWLRSPYGQILLEVSKQADELVKRYRNA